MRNTLKNSPVFLIVFWGICLMLESGQVIAQDKNPETFSKSKWERLKKGLDYDRKIKEKPVRERTYESSDSRMPMFNLSSPLKIILFIVLIVVLAFLVIWIVASNTQINVPKDDIKADLTEDTEVTDISRDYLKSELQKELQAGNYRMAMRIYYLLIIKTLHDNELILWKKEKTNRQYIKELKGQGEYMEFASLTSIYEMVWYGDKQLELGYMQNSCGSFEKFLSNLDQKD